MRWVILVLVGPMALAACAGGQMPNSGIFAGTVTGVVSNTDGTCLSSGPNFFAGPTGGRVCFAGSVGHLGQCVTVSSHTPAVNSHPPYRFPVDQSSPDPGACRPSPRTP